MKKNKYKIKKNNFLENNQLFDSKNDEPDEKSKSVNECRNNQNGDLFYEKFKNFREELKERLTRKKNKSSENKISKNENKTIDSNIRFKDFSNCFKGKISFNSINTDEDEIEIIKFRKQNNSTPESRSPFVNRALPPLPLNDKNSTESLQISQECDFDESIQSNNEFGVLSLFKEKAHSSNNFLKTRYNSQNLNNIKQKNANIDEKHLNFKTRCFGLFSHPPPHIHSRKIKSLSLYNEDKNEINEHKIEIENSSIFSKSFNNKNSNLINLNRNLVKNSIIKPQQNRNNCEIDEEMKKMLDYAASIEKVKDCGWYWGPISGDKAERLLINEPEGSFIVRDSSDEHYIFSLTFKLNGDIRHVRIEHDQGNFSFGSLQKFSSSTIVDFIKEAVEHSRSGRYLFFLHRLPVMGPMRVQLLHPVSRFKRIQSLQHLCRFVILKHVRRDLILTLPLPDKVKNYLNTANYYAET